MVRRGGLLCGLLMALVSLGACNPEAEPFNPNPGDDDDDSENHRPTLSSVSVEGTSGDIQISFIPSDEDGDDITVTFQFSTSDGVIYQFCTASGRLQNPTEELKDGEAVTFVWDSAEDVGTAEVILRLVPNDGHQDGEAVVTDKINTTNPEPGDDDDDDDSSGGGDDDDDDSSGGGDDDDDDSSGGGDDDDDGDDPLADVGDIADVEVDGSGAATIKLNKLSSSDRDNTEEEFLIIVANTGNSAADFTLSRTQDSSSSSSSRTADTGARLETRLEPEPWLSPFRESLREWARYTRRLRADLPAARTAPVASYTVGETRTEFKVRESLDNDREYTTTIGVLGAVGDAVLIYVDEDVPIDWDYDCDMKIDEPDRQGRKTFGFDNCDLTKVADVFDNNIVKNLQAAFDYEVSDIDGNGRISVLITPLLNTLTTTNSSTTDDDQLVEVHVDPEVDLTDYDAKENPGSNEQEIIYLHAPDPAGFYNPATGGGGSKAVDAYVTVGMAANIAIATQQLISYNAHVLVADGDPEADWLSDGLGLLAADLTGFGSVAYADVIYYLDAPNLNSLTAENTINDVDDRGAQYLMCRYLVDTHGMEILRELMDGTETGTDNIAGALQATDSGATFEDLLLDFAVAIGTAGLKNSKTGEALTSIDGFAAATDIPVDSTDYYGAGGYQQGINLPGMNYARNRSSDGSLVTDEYRFNRADWNNYAPGTLYNGYLSAGISVQFTRVGGLIDKRTSLTLTTSSEDVKVRVVRLNDITPSKPTFVVEQVFGSLATDLIPMQLFQDGSESVALGDVDASQDLELADGSTLPVTDTDLYVIDLSSWAKGTAQLAVHLDRSVTSSSGGGDLDSPFLAVVPLDDLPDPLEVEGTYDCSGEEIEVYYPSSFLEYLYYQYVLIPKAGTSTDYNPAGGPSEFPTACNFDLEREQSLGVFEQNDEDEPLPGTFIDQIWTYQVQYLGGVSSVSGFYPYSKKFLDVEGQDTDKSPSYDFELGVGGRNLSEGEDAWLVVDLPSGGLTHQYVLVVGAPDSTGRYELTARALSHD